jgi:hypothetical protein
MDYNEIANYINKAQFTTANPSCDYPGNTYAAAAMGPCDSVDEAFRTIGLEPN